MMPIFNAPTTSAELQMSDLIDTNVLSELRKHNNADPNVLRWFEPIKATALVHDLTLVTRNVRDVAKTGVKLINPFEENATASF
jgi:predicted nucleic acid-binding protein